jgi:hypothetical protein
MTHLQLKLPAEGGDIPTGTCPREAAVIGALGAQDGGQTGTVDGVDNSLAGIRFEMDLHGVSTAQALGNQRYLFPWQENRGRTSHSVPQTSAIAGKRAHSPRQMPWPPVFAGLRLGS